MNRFGPRGGSRPPAAGGPVERAAEEACAGPDPLLPAGERVLVACSGGADSVALAAVLGERPSGSLRASLAVSLGHVDHGLREGSSAEAEQVRALAARLGVPFFCERLTDLGPAVARDGLEAAARVARYAALARLARASGSATVATAHTRSDQAETVLLRLARGAGPGALAGVRRARPLAAEGPSAAPLRLVRPLLSVSRADTEACCRARGLPFVRDPHNDDPRRARARIREELPRLAALLNPRLEEALAGAAALAADEDDLLTRLAAAEFEKARREGGASAPLLRALHPALLRRCLLACAAEAGVRPEREHLERLALLLDRPSARLDVPGGRAVVDQSVLRFERGPFGGGAPEQPPADLAIPCAGTYRWGEAVLEVGAAEGPPTQRAIALDLARAPFPWTLRAPRPGDRFRPGGGRLKKVADLLAEAGVPRAARPRAAVLADAAGALFFVEGVRPGAPARGEPSAPGWLSLSRGARELGGTAGGLSVVKRAARPHASMPPHRPDEEQR